MKNISYIKFSMLLILLTGCLQPTQKEKLEEHHDEKELIEFTQEQYNQAGISTGKAQKRVIGSELEVNGIIDVPPHGNISINLPYGGFLKSTSILTGTEVKKGQLIATVQNPNFISFQQEYQESLAQREFLKAEYERDKALFEGKIISEKEFQRTKSIYKSNEVGINALAEKLKLIGFNIKEIANGEITSIVNIYAPVSGFVKEVYANVGKYISPQDAIMDITDVKDLHIELSVYENDIPKVKNGQVIYFSVANSPNLTREAEVFLVGKNVRKDRSITVHGHLNSNEKDLLPGMYISAQIVTGSYKTWTVPEEAVVRFQGKNYIFAFVRKVQENKQTLHQFKMVEINKGITEKGFSQINLKEKKESIEMIDIVLKGAFYILSKSKNSEEGGHGH